MTSVNYKNILGNERAKWEADNGPMTKKQYCSLYSKIRNKYDDEFRIKNLERAKALYEKNREAKNEENKLRAKNNRPQYNIYQKKYYHEVIKPKYQLEKQQAINV